ncbi:MAG: hypothetical protein ACKVSF_13435 [Alphaproteobacteria bacterium]
MGILEKLPSLSDAELGVLRLNAAALERTGTPKQKTAVADLMPSLDAEFLLRRERKAAARPAPKGRARKSPPPAEAEIPAIVTEPMPGETKSD